MDSGESEMNPVRMTIIQSKSNDPFGSPRSILQIKLDPRIGRGVPNEKWPSRISNERPSVLKSFTLPTELHGLDSKVNKLLISIFEQTD